MNSFNDIACYSGLKRIGGLDGYIRNQVFRSMDLRNKKVLDIGGGNGLISLWCLMEGGCEEAVLVDPFDDGSNKRMFTQLDAMRNLSPVSDRLIVHNGIMKDFSWNDCNFDVVVLHNSINHINEKMTPEVDHSKVARGYFIDEIRQIKNKMNEQASLVVADCSNRNFFGDMKLKSPLAPTINWNAHQPPNVWVSLIEEAGFRYKRLTWTTRREFGNLGYKVLGNRFGAYFTSSHFVLEFYI